MSQDKAQKANLKELDKLLGRIEKLCPTANSTLLRIAEGAPHLPTLERIEEFQEMLNLVSAALFSVQEKAMRAGCGTSRRLAAQITRRMQQGVPKPKSAPSATKRPARAQAVVPLSGDGSVIPIMSVLTLLSLQRKSGVMRANLGKETITMDIANGCIVRLTCAPLRRGERLGEILAEWGNVNMRTILDFLDTHEASTGNLGEALVGKGLVSRQELEEALTEQLQRRLDRVLGAETCTFEFREEEIERSIGFRIEVKELQVNDITRTVKIDKSKRYQGLPGEFESGWEKLGDAENKDPHPRGD